MGHAAEFFEHRRILSRQCQVNSKTEKAIPVFASIFALKGIRDIKISLTKIFPFDTLAWQRCGGRVSVDVKERDFLWCADI